MAVPKTLEIKGEIPTQNHSVWPPRPTQAASLNLYPWVVYGTFSALNIFEHYIVTTVTLPALQKNSVNFRGDLPGDSPVKTAGIFSEFFLVSVSRETNKVRKILLKIGEDSVQNAVQKFGTNKQIIRGFSFCAVSDLCFCNGQRFLAFRVRFIQALGSVEDLLRPKHCKEK